MRIAVHELDPALAHLVSFVARRRGHDVVSIPALDAQLGGLPFPPSALLASVPDLDTSTLSWVSAVKKTFPNLVIVLVTEGTRDDELVRALSSGVDDVVRIPYNPVEVVLRLEKRLDTTGAQSAGGEVVRVEDLEIDLVGYTAVKNGQALRLTRLELRLLYCLAESSPQVAAIDRLLSFGWDVTDEPDVSILKTHISHLRNKLRDAGGTPMQIHSRMMIGYTLSAGKSA